MKTEIDTMSATCNTIGAEDWTPGVDRSATALRKQARKRMRDKRQRRRQAEKAKKKLQKGLLKTPRQKPQEKKKPMTRTPAMEKSPTFPRGLSLMDTKADRVQIQFRCGAALVERIDRAAAADGLKRNDWLIKTVIDALGVGIKSVQYDAVIVNTNRKPILFRVGSRVREEIDKAHAAAKLSRTMWILCAILTALDNYDFS